jgi:hypothetical protein
MLNIVINMTPLFFLIFALSTPYLQALTLLSDPIDIIENYRVFMEDAAQNIEEDQAYSLNKTLRNASVITIDASASLQSRSGYWQLKDALSRARQKKSDLITLADMLIVSRTQRAKIPILWYKAVKHNATSCIKFLFTQELAIFTLLGGTREDKDSVAKMDEKGVQLLERIKSRLSVIFITSIKQGGDKLQGFRDVSAQIAQLAQTTYGKEKGQALVDSAYSDMIDQLVSIYNKSMETTEHMDLSLAFRILHEIAAISSMGLIPKGSKTENLVVETLETGVEDVTELLSKGEDTDDVPLPPTLTAEIMKGLETEMSSALTTIERKTASAACTKSVADLALLNSMLVTSSASASTSSNVEVYNRR